MVLKHLHEQDILQFPDVLQVANPHDILLFTKAPKRRTNADGLVLFLSMTYPGSHLINNNSALANIWSWTLHRTLLFMLDCEMVLHEIVGSDTPVLDYL